MLFYASRVSSEKMAAFFSKVIFPRLILYGPYLAMLSRMFYSHFKSVPKKSIRPLVNELHKSIANKLKDTRPSAYESQKSIP